MLGKPNRTPHEGKSNPEANHSSRVFGQAGWTLQDLIRSYMKEDDKNNKNNNTTDSSVILFVSMFVTLFRHS